MATSKETVRRARGYLKNFYRDDKKIQGNDWDLQNKCFKKIIRSYENENWEKIHAAAHLITGIKNSNGKGIADIFGIKNLEAENLVFQGGEPKGIAYIGALRVLEKKKVLGNIRRLAGTSSGAITTTFLALGYSVDEAEQHLMGMQLIEFMDSSVDKKALIALISSPKNEGCTFSKVLGHIRNSFEYSKILHHFLNSPGLCKGDVFLQWISQAIKDKTGDPNLTFGELRDRAGSHGFKHLEGVLNFIF